MMRIEDSADAAGCSMLLRVRLSLCPEGVRVASALGCCGHVTERTTTTFLSQRGQTSFIGDTMLWGNGRQPHEWVL
jgi:hypothetical protein